MTGKTAATGTWRTIRKDYRVNKLIYLMMFPLIIYYIIFNYLPMYGILIAFQDFSIVKGVWGSAWVGFQNFTSFFHSVYFWRTIKNAFLLSFYDIAFGFPAPIILALLLNEIKFEKFKRTVQTISYLPHFVSMVVIAGMMVNFLSRDGLINNIVAWLGGPRIVYLLQPEWFRAIYVSSNIWQGVGWGSIIYLAALTSVDPGLYEASKIDGAGRWKQLWHITLPGIMPTIMIMLILRLSGPLAVSFEKILLLYNTNTYVTADVIDTYVYRRGILGAEYGFSTAVGLFGSVVGLIFLIAANQISRRFSENSLW